MFAKSDIEVQLEEQIASALDKLAQLEPKSEEFDVLVDRIARLHKLKSDEHEQHRIIRPMSMDAALYVSANIFGILWLARYERDHVIHAPKAFGFIIKPR